MSESLQSQSPEKQVPSSLAAFTSNIPNELFLGPDGRPVPLEQRGSNQQSQKNVPRALVNEDDIMAVEGIMNHGGSNERPSLSHTPSFVDLQGTHQNHRTENARNFGTSRLDDVAPNADGIRRLRTSASSSGLSAALRHAKNEPQVSSTLSLPAMAQKAHWERETPEICVPLNPDTGSVPIIHPEQTDRGLPYAPDEKFVNSGSRKLPRNISLDELSRSPPKHVDENGNHSDCAPPEPWENEYNEVLDDVERAAEGTASLPYTSKPLAEDRQRSHCNLTESDNICGLTAGKSEPMPDIDPSTTIDENSSLEPQQGFFTKDGEGTAGMPFDVVSNLPIPNENAHHTSWDKRKPSNVEPKKATFQLQSPSTTTPNTPTVSRNPSIPDQIAHLDSQKETKKETLDKEEPKREVEREDIKEVPNEELKKEEPKREVEREDLKEVPNEELKKEEPKREVEREDFKEVPNEELKKEEPKKKLIREGHKKENGEQFNIVKSLHNDTTKDQEEMEGKLETEEQGVTSPEDKAESVPSSDGSETSAANETARRLNARPNKFTGSRAGFVAALESRLQKGPLMQAYAPKPKSPSRSESETSVMNNPCETNNEAANKDSTDLSTAPSASLPDARKTRARGPARRPPTIATTKSTFMISDMDVFLEFPPSNC
ncbi:barbed end F-actin assembly inhibitor [Schizosaccharomyces osmophilus]|uniref:Barbed end F-actin assembly inhibitor n=1 Tax=Schizosaccharomyces osmophilus TaxID=2545709 RepID=A0AAF0AVH5_9SCHI|nr:barbed end F-actin assembly inhibitor [Schizosaccharomyces osmophilus]WBW71959.1 barbed end F-actin assembly inhibitor [Schizosaccharomyces osmophilus]